jgi:hypothetical protein
VHARCFEGTGRLDGSRQYGSDVTAAGDAATVTVLGEPQHTCVDLLRRLRAEALQRKRALRINPWNFDISEPAVDSLHSDDCPGHDPRNTLSA